MALTLSEAAKLSNDLLVAGVAETIVKESRILNLLPWVDLLGNTLTYNRENAMASAAFYGVGDTWSESTPTHTQVSASLAILGGDADVDTYVQQTRSNVQDIRAEIVLEKAKAVAHQFEDAFVYGNTSSDANSFNGLHLTIPSGQQLHAGSGTTPAALSLATLDQLIDLIKPGKPDVLLMSRRTRRGLSAYSRATQSPVTYEPTELGARTLFYDGIPIIVSDFVTDTEAIASGAYSAKTGGASTSVFALKLGTDLLHGITNGGLQVEDVGRLETKDALRTRIKWYVNGCVLRSTLAVARLDGLSSAAVTA